MILTATHKTLPSWLSLFVALLFSATTLAQGELTATVDRTQLSLEETLTLKVWFNKQVMFDEPDFDALKQNFEILGNHRSNQYRSVNGQAESWTQWQMTLSPRKSGRLLIPSFSYEGSFSDAIEINVRKVAQVQTNSIDQPVFLETQVDKQKIFVQEQILYTVRLFTSVDLNGLGSEDFMVENALVKQVSETQYQRTINGKLYGVVEITYAIFPQKSGPITLPSTRWNVTLQSRQNSRYDLFLSRGGKRLQLHSQEKIVDVLPKPGNYSGDHWLPASRIELSQSWSQAPTSFTVGEPITRTIHIQADGLQASQLPPLQLQTMAGVKYYLDQPQFDEKLDLKGIHTVKTESYAIVPSQAGKLTLPAISVTWWDTQAQRMREASLPVQIIEVATNGNPTVNIPQRTAPVHSSSPPDDQLEIEPSQRATPVRPYWILSLLLGLSTLTFALLWWRAKNQSNLTHRDAIKNRHKDDTVREKERYKTLKEALAQQQMDTIRETLLAWAQAHWPQSNIHSLGQLELLCPPLKKSLQTLEQKLYGDQDTNFNSAQLLQEIESVRQKKNKAAAADSDALPPLYS